MQNSTGAGSHPQNPVSTRLRAILRLSGEILALLVVLAAVGWGMWAAVEADMGHRAALDEYYGKESK